MSQTLRIRHASCKYLFLSMSLKIFSLLVAVLLLNSCKQGCTESEATNFNPDAKKDDGSCYYEGCMDSLATNYWPLADTDDGSCEYESQLHVGVYIIQDSIHGGILPFEYSHREYEIVVEQHPDFPENLVITNFANIFSISAQQETVAEVEGSSFILSQQNVVSQDQNLEEYVILNGLGTLTDEGLLMDFEFLNGFGEAFSGSGTGIRVEPIE